MLTEQETLLRRGARAEGSRVREPRRTALPRGLQSRVSFRVVSGQSSCLVHSLTQGPSWWRISQPRWIPVRRTLGGWSSPPSFGPS